MFSFFSQGYRFCDEKVGSFNTYVRTKNVFISHQFLGNTFRTGFKPYVFFFLQAESGRNESQVVFGSGYGISSTFSFLIFY